MENKTDYEKAKAECWGKFYNEELKGRPQWEPIGTMQIFDYAFKEAYRYGRMVGMEEAKKQYDGALDHIPDTTKKIGEEVNFPAGARIAAMAMHGLLANALWVQGKTELIRQEHGEDIDRCAEALVREIAEDAVEFAEALISELGKKKQSKNC